MITPIYRSIHKFWMQIEGLFVGEDFTGRLLNDHKHLLDNVIALATRDCTDKARLELFVFSEVLDDDVSTHTEPHSNEPVIRILAHHLIYHQSVLICPTYINTIANT